MSSSGNTQFRQPRDDKSAKKAQEYLLALSRVAVDFARVYRAPRYSDGAKESDVEHSYHLALSAAELAASYFPDLDTGLVTQFALVHDLPELYAGDTPTLGITDANRAQKEAAERIALDKLLTELPPHTAQLLERYEKQEEPEARFVRFVDKLMPALTLIIAGSQDLLNEDLGIADAAYSQDLRIKEAARLQALFPEFPFIDMVHGLVLRSLDGQASPLA